MGTILRQHLTNTNDSSLSSQADSVTVRSAPARPTKEAISFCPKAIRCRKHLLPYAAFRPRQVMTGDAMACLGTFSCSNSLLLSARKGHFFLFCHFSTCQQTNSNPVPRSPAPPLIRKCERGEQGPADRITTNTNVWPLGKWQDKIQYTIWRAIFFISIKSGKINYSGQ